MTIEFPGTRTGRSPKVVAAAFAGTDAGTAALAPAARVLRRSLDGTRLMLLWPSTLRLPVKVEIEFDDRIDYPAPAGAAALCRTIDTLAASACDGMIIFTQSGWSAHVPAYIAYLAGIPRRAGLTAEFGGAVLSDPVACTASLTDEDRHLFLLRAIGFEPRRAEPAAPYAAASSPVERRA